MATYPNVNAANQYARDIVGGKILACQLTILACQRHLDDLERAKDPHWPYRFDKNKAERFLRFAQKMPHTSGEWARRKLRIEFEAWQKFALGVPFGWVHKKTGLRRFSEIYIEVPRKNGKSAIAAAVGNYMFCADDANSRVDNMAKTLSDSQSTQASLNTSLQSQIDAQAAANIKNQTTLDNTIKSVASITSTQQTHATALEALATQQTTLTSSVGDLSASVQNTAKTVADVNGTVSSLWSMKVETVNGKNVGAGITLGSNGETSDMILYADRFSLFNRNNATAVPVMIAEGNELYIDTARIKNSSLTSTKIADGSITNAKIGNEIRSNNFVDGSQGWRIAKDGSSQFNNVIVRGRVEANSGVFRGTVQADAFIGDIAVAKGYDSLTFRRNQTVQRNGAYQNRGYSMTVVLACTLVCQTYGTGSGLGYTSDITFNIGGQEVTRRIFVDAGNITAGTTAFELRFAARLDADYNNVGFFIKATGRNAAIDYTCTVENITATAFRTDSSSFS
ncbi:terminase large subunit domain-containing protein [Klebsiella variicola]|uniref:terminase large subunit domain-containing protein n=1 Tax=Klebsiella variicola TaxID=244366 RepID=UPI002FF746A8